MSMPMTLAPSLDAESPEYFFRHSLENGEFKLQQCNCCQQYVFYPRLLCPLCGSGKLTWMHASGKGIVYSCSTARNDGREDYNISLIDLAEGPRMLARVTDIKPDEVYIGMPVEAFIGSIHEVPVVLFRRGAQV